MARNAKSVCEDRSRQRKEASQASDLKVRLLTSAATIFISACWILLALAVHNTCAAAPQTKNVFLITIDGLRWQEVFRGADPLLMNKENGGVADTNRLNAAFWRDTPDARRAELMPFFWSVVAKQGQLYGNTNKGSVAVLTNGKKFTYPGFNEILTGFADPGIDKNEKRNNPNVTVLEWLHQKRAFTNRVVAFANWDVFPYILNTQRSGIPMWTGFETNSSAERSSRLELLEQLFQDTTPLWPDMSFDAFFFHAALEHLKMKKPRVMWIALSEPDEWAHEGRYDYYLAATHKIDGYVRALWATAQSQREYRDKTTFILTCDHGRGSGAKDWKNHGAHTAGAEYIWLAVIGPDTPALGERTNTTQIGQNQIAATLAALLGEEYHSAIPKSGVPITDILPAKAARIRQ